MTGVAPPGTRVRPRVVDGPPAVLFATVACFICVILPIFVRQVPRPLGQVIGLVILVACVVLRARTSEGLCLADAGADSGSVGAFGLEGCFLILIGSLGLLEDVDDLPALLSDEIPWSAIHVEINGGRERERVNVDLAGFDSSEKRCREQVCISTRVNQCMRESCRLTLLMTFPDLLMIVTVSVSCIL